MKNSFLTLLTIYTLTSCTVKKPTLTQQFEESFKTWTKLKKEKGANYKYIREEYGADIHPNEYCGSETIVNVRRDTVVGRSLEHISRYRDTGKESIRSVSSSETIYGINIINANEEGFRGVIFDSIYKKCKSEILNNSSENNTIVFDVDKNGIISNCYYSIQDCVDKTRDCKNECTSGFIISSFEWKKVEDFDWLEKHRERLKARGFELNKK